MKIIDSVGTYRKINEIYKTIKTLEVELRALEDSLCERAANALKKKGVKIESGWLCLRRLFEDEFFFDVRTSDGASLNDSYRIKSINLDTGELDDEEAKSENQLDRERKERLEYERLKAKFE